MRRSGYTPRADFQLEGTLRAEGSPFRVARYSAGGDLADYVMARYLPEYDWAAPPAAAGRSGGGGRHLGLRRRGRARAEDRRRRGRAAGALADGPLRAGGARYHAGGDLPEGGAGRGLREGDLRRHGAASPSTPAAAPPTSGRSSTWRSGASTGREQPAVVYIGDGLPTSGEILADKLAERLRRALSTSSRARFFTVAVGADANHALLRELSRAGGRPGVPHRRRGRLHRRGAAPGQRREDADHHRPLRRPRRRARRADDHRQRQGLARGGDRAPGAHAPRPAREGHGEGACSRASPTARSTASSSTPGWAPRWCRGCGRRRRSGACSARRPIRTSTAARSSSSGVDYGLVTPFTSILALDSEQAYAQQGIHRRRSPLRGVRLTALTPGGGAARRRLPGAAAAGVDDGVQGRRAGGLVRQQGNGGRACGRRRRRPRPESGVGGGGHDPHDGGRCGGSRRQRGGNRRAAPARRPRRHSRQHRAGHGEPRGNPGRAGGPQAGGAAACSAARRQGEGEGHSARAEGSAADRRRAAARRSRQGRRAGKEGAPRRGRAAQAAQAPARAADRPVQRHRAPPARRAPGGLAGPAQARVQRGGADRSLRGGAHHLRDPGLPRPGRAALADPGQGPHRGRGRGAARPLRRAARDAEVHRPRHPPAQRRPAHGGGGAAGALRGQGALGGDRQRARRARHARGSRRRGCASSWCRTRTIRRPWCAWCARSPTPGRRTRPWPWGGACASGG